MAKRVRRNRTPFVHPHRPRRAEICVQTDRPDDVRAAKRWLELHRAELTFVSDDEGCGCCVHTWRVEGPADVVGSLPPEISATSDWSRQ
jgi:hypothetical protein